VPEYRDAANAAGELGDVLRDVLTAAGGVLFDAMDTGGAACAS
jgi:hypothetical protein